MKVLSSVVSGIKHTPEHSSEGENVRMELFLGSISAESQDGRYQISK